MRAWVPLTLAFYAVCAVAQNNAINVPAGQSTLEVTAGQPLTITWTNPSSGTVTIKLQQGTSITPDSGAVLASGIEASAQTATFTIPASANTHQYTIEIIDDTNPSNYNFSPNFSVADATGTQTDVLPSSTGSATASTALSSGSSAATTSFATSVSSASASASSASASESTSNSSASASSASTAAASSTISAAATSQTTSAPTSNAAMPLKVQGGLLFALLGGAALV